MSTWVPGEPVLPPALVPDDDDRPEALGSGQPAWPGPAYPRPTYVRPTYAPPAHASPAHPPAGARSRLPARNFVKNPSSPQAPRSPGTHARGTARGGC